MSKLSLMLAALLVSGVASANMAPPAIKGKNPSNLPVSGAPGGAGGSAGSGSPFGLGGLGGGFAGGTIAAGTIIVGVGAALGSNSSGNSLPTPPVTPTPKCTGTDPLVNGLCVGTRQDQVTTITGSGTGTGTTTTTITVPVTFTYTPTLG